MKLLKIAALCTTTTLGSMALAGDVSVFDVEVKTDLSSFSDANAMTYWPNLGDDMLAAIRQNLTVSGDDEDPMIRVEINKVAVDGDTILPDSGEFNELEGTVSVYPGATNDNAEVDQGNVKEQSFPIYLSAVTGDMVVPEGWSLVAPSQDKFYNEMVNGFARVVVDNIEQ